MERTQLTKHFWLKEFTASATARAAGREVVVRLDSPVYRPGLIRMEDFA